MIHPGIYTATVLGTRIDQMGKNGTNCIVVDAQIPEMNEPVECIIWMTEKSMRMARQQIKAIGFDIDTTDLEALHMTTLLHGRTFSLVAKVEEWPLGSGKVRMKYEVAMPPPDTRGLTASLRAAGSESSRSRQPAQDAPPSRGAPPAARMPGDGVREAGRSAREDAARMPPPPARPATPKLPEPGSDYDSDIPF